MSEARTLLVRYDEIGLKGRNRRYFENCLLANIKRALDGLGPPRFRVPHGRILVDTDQEHSAECARRLTRVPGIASVSVGVPVEREFDAMASVGIERIAPRLHAAGALKFCVRSQRSDKSFHKTSPQIDFEVGSRIMQRLAPEGLTVDIKHADFVLEIEVGEHETVVFDNRHPGLGGLPVGSAGEVLCLLSGGIDSPVAAFLMARRGCRVHYVFFDNQPFLGRGGFDKVERLARLLNRYQGEGRLYVVPFEEAQVAIRDHCRPANRVVLYRRMMYRIAAALAEAHQCLGLVTGESLGQVASQTLENLAAVSSTTRQSIFRPCIGLDKRDIIAWAKKIGTYDISVEPHPDCCSVFMPPRPATRAKEADLERDEERFPWQELVLKALSAVRTYALDAPTENGRTSS
jgi:thiamine biosynthesis protein ThiI